MNTRYLRTLVIFTREKYRRKNEEKIFDRRRFTSDKSISNMQSKIDFFFTCVAQKIVQFVAEISAFKTECLRS
jgi:hypothetical protein